MSRSPRAQPVASGISTVSIHQVKQPNSANILILVLGLSIQQLGSLASAGLDDGAPRVLRNLKPFSIDFLKHTYIKQLPRTRVSSPLVDTDMASHLTSPGCDTVLLRGVARISMKNS
ncbi:hypothetical protein BDDG_12559 [Blastomyces dermatitidis ATCC 18188]|uniref:Uncharacterized protein n=1 Tax=Ajellomyces dermatitidis (strain ATCC 18188 / CBS 674.68) TaxID=653446 RepID=A0A0J9EQ00_AJEDA|nr:hypothetical protein BDDG_12559 [Blastomyces dermatitidis ATCC 18188]